MMKRIEDSILRRFISKIDIRSDNECWFWKAGKFSNGYGQFRLYNHKVKAHRVAYFIRNGKLPLYNSKRQELFVLHTCDEPACCNPKHLFLGTSRDNTMDAFFKNRRTPGEGNPNVKLSEERVWQIRLMLSKKIPRKEIAECFKIHESTISHINTGYSWKHLAEEPKVRLEV